ncbi:pyroglutamyl-peptidase I [Ramlibacter tataouinensis]|uniref:Pyrrolidone-carboxylate peptidase n=1 Tax=Ramlibacter tataouinensis (strain ATCC BAA-407 / DSM 14655 / LMG 21543 / TTB310) TaxID=365046 RepID=F5Y095_RAMTT|nr:pyroglutamyl-peptidase I [Ramlibacter tataouinensis]AEG92117.1 candidate pyrrolidone-carboxylate peptidase (5-oxoprolyl- peptidase) [Ramlibacter tataouinensis TTB310]
MLSTPPGARGGFPTVLVTGFDPFGGEALNPSALAARALHGRLIDGHAVVGAELPTVFGRSVVALLALLRLHRPALVLGCGQAGGRAAISLERVAINVDDARIADNAGAQPVDAPVVAGGPAAYFSTLPIKAMRAALQREGLPAEVSQTAGTFVCNHVFYGLMHALATQADLGGVRGGFVHVPWLPGQGQPSLPLADIVRGLELAIACALRTRQDIRSEAGALD